MRAEAADADGVGGTIRTGLGAWPPRRGCDEPATLRGARLEEERAAPAALALPAAEDWPLAPPRGRVMEPSMPSTTHRVGRAPRRSSHASMMCPARWRRQ
eukprot:7955111-Alexandrium_andersonii.AAC.1